MTLEAVLFHRVGAVVVNCHRQEVILNVRPLELLAAADKPTRLEVVARPHAGTAKQPLGANLRLVPPLQGRVEGDRLFAFVLEIHLQVILQVFAHAGQVMHQRNIKLLQQFRLAHAGALQDLWRGNRSGAQQHLFVCRCFGRNGAFAFQPLNAHGALAVKENAIGHGMGADGQVRALLRLVQIAARGAGASALWRNRSVHRAEAFLLIAVKIVRARVARLYARFHHCLKQRVHARFGGGDAHRAVAAVVVVRTHVAGFSLTVVGQAVEVAPVLQTRLFRPVVQIHRVAAHVAHAVDERRPAQPFTASAFHAAVIHIGLWLGFVRPVVALALQRECQCGRHLGAEVKAVIRAARFKQQNGGIRIFSQSCCQNVAGRAGTNNDVVKLQKNLPVKIWTGIYPSQPGWTSPGCNSGASSRRFRGRYRSVCSRQPASLPGIHPRC